MPGNSTTQRRRRGRRSGLRTFSGLLPTPVSTLRDSFFMTVPAASGGTSGSNSRTYTALPITNFNTYTIRCSSVDIEAVSATPGGVVAVSLYDFAGVVQTETREILLGSTVVRFRLRMPRSCDFGIVSNTSQQFLVAQNPSTVAITLSVIANFALRVA